jgi:hypothetical protein
MMVEAVEEIPGGELLNARGNAAVANEDADADVTEGSSIESIGIELEPHVEREQEIVTHLFQSECFAARRNQEQRRYEGGLLRASWSRYVGMTARAAIEEFQVSGFRRRRKLSPHLTMWLRGSKG